MELKDKPLLKLLFYLIIGILVGDALPSISSVFIVCLAFSLAVLCILFFRFYRYTSKIVFICCLFLGIFLSLIKKIEIPYTVSNTKSIYKIKVISLPEYSTIGGKMEVEAWLFKDSVQIYCGKGFAYIRKTENQVLNYEDVFLYYGQLRPFSAPKNPGEFNFKDYALRKGFFYSVYIHPEKIVQIPTHETGNILFQASYNLKRKLLELLKMYIENIDSRAILSSLVLGFKLDLDDTLYDSYSKTGTVHILSVSGLHVAALFLMVTFLLRFIIQKEKSFLRILITLSIIWFYAILTGLSAPVVRCGVMFSFIEFGKYIHRKGNSINTTAASAFLLLCYNPYWIYDVGFQLSYAAIFGIILFYRTIYSQIIFSNYFADKIWEIFSTTIAAQIFTLPFTVYYFHRIAVLGLLSNIIVVPLSAIILYLSILFFILGNIAFLGIWLGKLLDYLVQFQNWIIEKSSNLPYSSIDAIFLDFPAFIILSVGVICLIIFFSWRNKKAFYGALLIFLSFTIFQFVQTYQSIYTKKLVVYNHYKHSVIEYFEEEKVYSFSEDRLDTFPKIQKEIQNARGAIRKMETIFQKNIYPKNYTRGVLYSDFVLVFLPAFFHKKIADSTASFLSFPAKKYVVVNKKIEFKNLVHWIGKIQPTQVILDSSLKPKQRKKLEEILQDKFPLLPIYSLAEKEKAVEIIL